MQNNIEMFERIKYAVVAVLAASAIMLGVPFAVAPAAVAEAELVEYTGRVEHIFTHELVFDTDRAFASDNKLRDCFDKDHLTAREFKALLNELYNNNYALVSLDGVIEGKPIMLPQGKKPLVLSFDDMTYDTVGRGCIDKLIMHDGKLCDYTASAAPQISRERENVTILESFIELHPDFSPTGGRATLCVNGYNGILGYRITPDCRVGERVMKKEIKECKAFVNALKSLGYTFASHTYYHSYFNSASAKKLREDCEMWRKHIAPVVGDTRVLCYPAGQHRADGSKNEIFKEFGFDVFLCVGSYDGTDYERNATSAKYIYRRPFDGTALRLYGKLYAHLANTRAIYDNARFRPFEYKGGYY